MACRPLVDSLKTSKDQMSQGDRTDSPAYSTFVPWTLLLLKPLEVSKDQMSQGDLTDSPAYSTFTLLL